MVEDRDISEFEIKLNNFLKHLPCRKIKVNKIDIDRKDTETLIATILELPNTEGSGAEASSNLIVAYNKVLNEDSLDIKSYIDLIKSKIPEYYKSVFAKSVQTALKAISYPFSEDKVPNTFEIVKLPYRQISVRTLDKPIFIDLCNSSYSRILEILDDRPIWTNVIDFEKLVKCMKRRELVTLLLMLSQSELPNYN